MILIQFQLCSIDQSDLFIPRSGGKINPAPPPPLLFSPVVPYKALHIKVPQAVVAACTYRYIMYTKQKCCLSNQLTPAKKAISPCPPV